MCQWLSGQTIDATGLKGRKQWQSIGETIVWVIWEVDQVLTNHEVQKETAKKIIALLTYILTMV